MDLQQFHRRYAQVCQHAREIALLQSTLDVLTWDEQTYLPPEAGPYRAEQIRHLAGLIHERRTDRAWGKELEQLAPWAQEHLPYSAEADNLRLLLRDWRRQSRLPQSLVEELAHTTSRAQQVWTQARPQNDYQSFAPWLQRVLELKRQQAQALGYQEHPYDALLEDYEPECTTAQVRQVLLPLGEALRELLQRIVGSPQQPEPGVLRGRWPQDQQEKLGHLAAQQIGYDFRRGRLDVTAHPFCTRLGPHDVRITTRYDETYFPTAFFGILHEAGHGLYEQGLPADQFGLPRGEAVSLGVHESQSRLWENHVGRSLGFWRYFFPEARELFAPQLDQVSLEQFHRAINRVAPSLIRVEADEVSYNLHILIRFELELELLEDNLPVDDLPEAWNQKYEHYLGIRPADVAQGVMQDIHWSAGLVGYFPTYSLGNLYAAQLMHAAQEELGDLEELWARGEFRPLLEWLRTQVHSHGRRFAPVELLRRATGQEPSAKWLLHYLKQRFEPLYGL